jgi:murein DD-endopeptidase MepM/ murein hydrolase activator NlpD
VIEARLDKPVGRTPRRVVATLAVTALATALFGTGHAFAQSGGTGPPGGTTPTPPPPSAPPAPSGTLVFPVAGPHSFGDGIGAARGSRSHQGQDIFASCGTPLVAISRARVKMVKYQGAAGHYVVIRNKKLKQDYMYAHLATRAPVRKRQLVQPGQQIGTVGQTGNARGCHLHFELWLGKYYRGGRPIDPMPYLQTYQGF